MPSEVSHETGEVSNLEVNEGVRSIPSDLLKRAILQELRDQIDELKIELIQLNNEVLKNRQRITNLEKGKKSYGKDVKKRVESMLSLIEDYGGSLKSSSIRKYMGLSKDELYRTLKCAKEDGLIEALPDPHDRRGSLICIIRES